MNLGRSWRGWAAVVLSLTLQAQVTEPRWTFSGFGTLGVAATDTHAVGFNRDLGQPHYGVIDQPNAKADTRLGGQVVLRLDDDLRGLVQVLSKYRYDGTWKPEINWAFLDWNPVGNVQVRVGRLGFEQILGADSKDVGFSYLWVRPSVESMGFRPISRFDGVDLSQRFMVGGQTQLRLKAFAGRANEKLAVRDAPAMDLAGSPVFGVLMDLQRGALLTRLAWGRFQFRNDWPGTIPEVGKGLETFAGILQDPRLLDSAQAIKLQGARGQVWNASVLWEGGRIQTQLNLQRSKGDRPVTPDSWTGFGSFGYRFGPVVPYVAFSRTVSSRPPVPELGALPLLPNPLAKKLVAAVGAMVYYPQMDQHTTSTGLRWDFRPDAAIKFQVDRIRTHNSVYGWYRNEPSWNGKAMVFTATLDFVFGRGL